MEATFVTSNHQLQVMGLIDEALFGKEVVKQIPILVKEWINDLK